MSVEEARKAILEDSWRAEMRGSTVVGGLVEENEHIDRLILEVRAEMPCYDHELSDNWRTLGDTADQHYTCADNWNDQAELLCPTCKARKELGR